MHNTPPRQPDTHFPASPQYDLCESFEKYALSAVQPYHFGHPIVQVPAAYFPLLRNEPTKSPRKTASRVRQLESTCVPKKTKQWKVQTAQKTRHNLPLSPARLESVPSNHRDQVTRFCTTNCPDCILSFTLHYSKFTIYLLSTTNGYFQPKTLRATF
jgi:hypothetical protein